jgi:hypothetical protein
MAEKWYSRQLSEDELKQFINAERNGKANKKAFVGLVEQEAALKIKQICGKNIKGIMLESESIRHSYKKAEHNLFDDDLLKFVDLINSADDIRLSEKAHQNNACLEFSKTTEDTLTVVVEIRTHFGGWLALVTCYRKK